MSFLSVLIPIYNEEENIVPYLKGHRKSIMKTFRQYLGVLIAGGLLFFLIKPFIQVHKQLEGITFEIQWGWLVLSFSVLLFYRSLYVYPFATLLSRITEKHVPFQDAFTLFHLSNITRYLPGRIWGVVRLLTLSQRFGLSKTNTASALTGHVGIETALGGLIAIALLFSKQMWDTTENVLEKVSGQTLLLTLAACGILTGGLFCIPKLAKHARAFLKALTPLLKNETLWVNALVSHSLLWCCQGLAFFLFVKSLAPVYWKDAGILTSCYAFAWIVGFLSFLTPGGLGIREGLLGILLANYMPTAQATLVALLYRLWMLSAESLLTGAAFCIRRQNSMP